MTKTLPPALALWRPKADVGDSLNDIQLRGYVSSCLLLLFVKLLLFNYVFDFFHKVQVAIIVDYAYIVSCLVF